MSMSSITVPNSSWARGLHGSTRDHSLLTEARVFTEALPVADQRCADLVARAREVVRHNLEHVPRHQGMRTVRARTRLKKDDPRTAQLRAQLPHAEVASAVDLEDRNLCTFVRHRSSNAPIPVSRRLRAASRAAWMAGLPCTGSPPAGRVARISSRVAEASAAIAGSGRETLAISAANVGIAAISPSAARAATVENEHAARSELCTLGFKMLNGSCAPVIAWNCVRNVASVPLGYTAVHALIASGISELSMYATAARARCSSFSMPSQLSQIRTASPLAKQLPLPSRGNSALVRAVFAAASVVPQICASARSTSSVASKGDTDAGNADRGALFTNAASLCTPYAFAT